VCCVWGLANENYLSLLVFSTFAALLLILKKWEGTKPSLLLVNSFGMSLILFFLFVSALQPYHYNTHPEEKFVSSGWLIIYFFSGLVLYVHKMIEFFVGGDDSD